MPATDEPLDPETEMAHYWADRADFVRGSTLLYFVLSMKPGVEHRTFRVRFKLDSHELYRMYVVDAEVVYP